MTKMMRFKKRDNNQKDFFNKTPQRYKYKKNLKVKPTKIKYERGIVYKELSEIRSNKPTDLKFQLRKKRMRLRKKNRPSEYQKHVTRIRKIFYPDATDIIYKAFDYDGTS